MALGPDGSTAWRRELDVGTGGNEKLERGLLRPDGTLVAVASEDAKAPFKGWVVRLDRDGKLLDQRLLDDPPGGRLLGVEEVGGSNLVTVGAVHARDRNDVDGWIVWLPVETSPARSGIPVAGQ